MTLLLGVDGCRGGWCGVAIEVEKARSQVGDPLVYASFAEVMATPAEVICVDIPIGLLDRPGQRTCDVEARRLLGPRRASSVFPPPSRRSLAFDHYPTASETNYQLTGKRLTQQSFNIRNKIREVDERLDSLTQDRVLEVHPELCFWALNSRSAVLSRKKRGRAGGTVGDSATAPARACTVTDAAT